MPFGGGALTIDTAPADGAHEAVEEDKGQDGLGDGCPLQDLASRPVEVWGAGFVWLFVFVQWRECCAWF